jgi:SAM-dependent methyltransferase
MKPQQGESSNSPPDEINAGLYDRSELVQEYAIVNLHPPEATALVRYHDDVNGRRVLDLGCGAGRLAVYLRPLTEKYVGVDRSPHMVAHCRRTFAGLPFFQADMRDLKDFGTASFDSVFAVFNLFDGVTHDDRLRIFAGVRRVLAPRGLLFFSSHNRNYTNAASAPHLQISRNPISQIRRAGEYIRQSANHRRMRTQQRFERDYALLNDAGYNYAVLHYYIGRDVQRQQLADSGFELIECLDERGRTLAAGADDSGFSSIHYIARPTA